MKRVTLLILVMTLILTLVWITVSPAQQKGEKAKLTEVPIGSPRSDDDFSKDADYLVEARRSTITDGVSAYLFKPGRCLKCHDNKPGVEGQIFYNYPDFKKDVDWPDYISHPDKKHAPSLKYDFYDMHAGRKKKLPMTIGQDMEQRMKQMD